MSLQERPPPTVNALDALGVSLTYRTTSGEIEALRDIALTVKDGEFVSIVGPSGCGKSSLLKLILGLERATRGSIVIGGTEISGPSRGVGAVFQAPVLLPWRTIEENVLLPVDVMRLDRKPATARARALLQLVGLGEFGARYPYELSGGMQHRAAIVRALVHDPQLLLMDEPFAALDALTRDQLYDDIQRIWQESGKTIVFVTHNVREAVCLGDRVVLMAAGPGRITQMFRIPLPRPRDINSPELAGYASQIAAALKGITGREAASE